MSREWKQYPDKVRVETAIGAVVLAITDFNHIYISTPDGEKCIVRGKQISGSLHVNDYGNGFEPSKDSSGMTWNSLYINKEGSFGNSATDAQRKAVLAAWVPAVNKFMSEHPELREAGKTADRNNKAQRIEEDIEKLEKQLAAKRAELKVVLNG